MKPFAFGLFRMALGLNRQTATQPIPRDRYRQLARRHIQTLNPAMRLQAMKDAIDIMETRMNGPFDGTAVEIPDLMMSVLLEYEGLLSKEVGQ